MAQFLILQLDGVLQAWGDHSYEDFRPSVTFPTRSGLLGLLAACLGIERGDTRALTELDASVWFTVRAEDRDPRKARTLKLTDFHTVLDARKVDIRKASEYPVVSRREYLCDAVFSVAVEEAQATPSYPLARIADALRRPVYTPFLGRRSCPLSRPLLATSVEAGNAVQALAAWSPRTGMLYSESPSLACDRRVQLRDVPRRGKTRQFATRQIFLHATESHHVSE